MKARHVETVDSGGGGDPLVRVPLTQLRLFCALVFVAGAPLAYPLGRARLGRALDAGVCRAVRTGAGGPLENSDTAGAAARRARRRVGAGAILLGACGRQLEAHPRCRPRALDPVGGGGGRPVALPHAELALYARARSGPAAQTLSPHPVPTRSCQFISRLRGFQYEQRLRNEFIRLVFWFINNSTPARLPQCSVLPSSYIDCGSNLCKN